MKMILILTGEILVFMVSIFWKFKPFQRVLPLLIIMTIISGCNFPVANSSNNSSPYQQIPSLLESNSDYTIDPAFESFYHSAYFPRALFGQPISYAYQDPESGNLVQYFQKARLESFLDENNQPATRLTPLGQYFKQQANGQEVTLEGGCKFFSGSDYPICQEFLLFYEANHGPALCGKPISNVYYSENHYFQYFENVLLVWFPLEPEPYQVTAANLGEMYLKSVEPLYAQITNPDSLEFALPDTNPSPLIQIEVAFEYPFIHPDYPQTVYVQVIDESGIVLEGLEITAEVILPDQTSFILRPGKTDAKGILSFTIQPFEYIELHTDDMIKVIITAENDYYSAQRASSFRILE